MRTVGELIIKSVAASNSISKIGMFLFALYLVLSVVGCASDRDLVNHLAREVYAENQPEEPLPPKPFASDGCSCWWDGDWVDCCVRHDLVYWMGGASEERKQADLELMKCLEGKGHSVIGRMMYMGVRVGGVWWLPTPFRWGFGWNYPDTGPPGKPYE